MGVYIKGMEMPTNCRVCRFAGLGGRRCELSVCMFTGESQPTLSPERMSACPLVPVPPHGRLIDGDYLKHTHCAECTLYPDKCLEKTEDGCDWGSIIHLRMCPTIIEAEGE